MIRTSCLISRTARLAIGLLAVAAIAGGCARTAQEADSHADHGASTSPVTGPGDASTPASAGEAAGGINNAKFRNRVVSADLALDRRLEFKAAAAGFRAVVPVLLF